MKSQTIIYLVRHGEVDNPQQIIYGRELDFPLTPAGRLQMRKLAEKLKNQGIQPQVIYTSPLLRTIQTAQEMANVFKKIPIIKKEALLESDSKGLTGNPLSWTRERDVYHWPGKDYWIESPETMTQRMTTVINKIREKILSGSAY